MTIKKWHNLTCKFLAGIVTTGFVYFIAPAIFIYYSVINDFYYSTSLSPGWHTTIYQSWMERALITLKTFLLVVVINLLYKCLLMFFTYISAKIFSLQHK